MDSMIGYKNEKYLYFGRAAARLDDVCNYIPARLGALFLTLSAFCLDMTEKKVGEFIKETGIATPVPTPPMEKP